MSIRELEPLRRVNKKTGKVKEIPRWQARYYDAAGKEHARNFRSYTAAETWEREQRAAVAAGTHIDPKAGQQAFGAYAEKWLRGKRRLRPASRETYESAINNRFHALANRRIRGITTDDINTLVDMWQNPPDGARHGALSPLTIALSYHLLKAIFQAAVDSGIIARNPCAGIELPEIPPSEMLLPTTDQLWDIVDLLPARFRAPVLLMAGCGPRIGEALGLTDDRVNWDAGEITFDRQWHIHAHQFAPLKKGTRGRTVPAPGFVMDALHRARREHGLGSYGLLFPSSRSRARPWSHSAIHTALAKAGVEVGLPTLTPHDLRHLYASVLIAAGETVATVAHLLGHATPAITLSTYAHLWARDDSQTRARVETRLSRPSRKEVSGVRIESVPQSAVAGPSGTWRDPKNGCLPAVSLNHPGAATPSG